MEYKVENDKYGRDKGKNILRNYINNWKMEKHMRKSIQTIKNPKGQIYDFRSYIDVD